MDFTYSIFQELLKALQSQGFLFYTVSEYAETNKEFARASGNRINPLPIAIGTAVANPKLILLRHDVEARYGNALKLAQLQHGLGIKGTYYFRIYPHKDNEAVIRKIVGMGHEIGYHYDDLSACRGDYEKALQRFQKNLAYLRQFAPVKTICMEGAPDSKYNNQHLWKTYSYQDYGISFEPYFDLDFNTVYYITDTGRRWDGKFSVRDKVSSDKVSGEFIALRFKHTKDIIKAVERGSFPPQAMLTFHPQRWNDKLLPWLKELFWQNIKNQVKRVLVKERV